MIEYVCSHKPSTKYLTMVFLLWLACIFDTQAAVSISGVDEQAKNNILAYLQLDDEACDAPDWRVRRLFKESQKEIREALEVIGYYHAEIEKQLIPGDACWQANFTITPGKPIVLRSVSINIDYPDEQNDELGKVVDDCELQSGEILQHARYDTCRRNITRTAKSQGYFDAAFTARRIDIYPAEHAADITLHLKAGRRYVFGNVTIDQSTLDPDLVKRAITFSPGQPYDATLTRKLQRDLISSAYFDQVNLTSKPRGTPHFDVPVHIKLTPGKKYQYNAGIGYATDVGPKLRLGILNRRFNTRGHQAEFEINLSNVISDVNFSYRIPLEKTKDWLTFDTFYKIEDNDSFESNLFSAGIQRIQKRSNGWMRNLFLNLRLEEYTTGAFEEDRSQLLTPGISYSFVEEDYPPRPLRGHHSMAMTRGAVDGVISDTSFLQVYGNTKWVFSLWSGGRMLTRAEAGATLIDELDTLPATVRFFAGGDTSVRGYAYNSLGPTDAFGKVVGGQNLAVGSVELDQQIATNWSLAGFIDSGNAYDSLDEFDPVTSVGAGIRWFSPLGPIRFDVAAPLDKDAPDNYRVHITLGPDL